MGDMNDESNRYYDKKKKNQRHKINRIENFYHILRTKSIPSTPMGIKLVWLETGIKLETLVLH